MPYDSGGSDDSGDERPVCVYISACIYISCGRVGGLAVSPPLSGEEVEPDFMVAARVNYVSEWNSETLLMSDARVFDL